jgi:hypothetical protein
MEKLSSRGSKSCRGTLFKSKLASFANKNYFTEDGFREGRLWKKSGTLDHDVSLVGVTL